MDIVNKGIEKDELASNFKIKINKIINFLVCAIYELME